MPSRDSICKYCEDLIYYDRDERKWVHIYNGKSYQGCVLQATYAEPVSSDERVLHYRITVFDKEKKTVITTKKRAAAVRYLNFDNTEVSVILERKYYGE